ncbi:YcaO-like family protein [Natrialba sp. PRR66]|uniref:YcaO-like family protein n=1 Tax=Natrialba sp. PRR66 TaxID=3098146 RepID=UPI002B1E7303|nr:YcaO-like family protein [Natrialba sp. PRR66]
MHVHVVADDPVRAALVAALDDVDVTVEDADPADLADARFAIVSDVAGARTFERANEAARAGDTPWIGVEIGGIGGHPLPEVDAAVSGFAPAAGPGVGCYDCLRTRVGAALDRDRNAGQPRTDRSTARFAGALAGRECVRVFSGAEQSVIGHAIELPHVRRRVLPVPGCACASSERDRTLSRDDDSLELDAAVEHAEQAIDERVGIIESIGEADSFPAPYYLATSSETREFSDASAPTQAAGVADDWNAALMKAVGEGLERYCAGVYRDDEFVHASEDDLDTVVSPTELVRPADAPADDATGSRRWVPGENLATGEAVHLPAAAVQFPPPGDELVPSITTGLGLGSSTTDALLSGLTEVIERDATMLAWYSTFEPLGLSVEDPMFDVLSRRARSEGLTVTPLLVTQDIDVPVVAVAVHREPAAVGTITRGDDGGDSGGNDAWPAFAVGSAAALDATAAAVSALEEALQNWMELRSLGPEEASEASGAIGDYGTFPETVRSFVDVEQTVPAAGVGPDSGALSSGEREESEGEGEGEGNLAELEAVIERVCDADLTPYAARLTTRDVEAAGFEVVRVVVPGAQPLFTGEPFFGERAQHVPATLGFDTRLDREFHPYP